MSALAIQLFHQDGKPSGVWYCSECRSVHSDERGAQSCHGITKCEDCGEELGTRQPYYRTKCQACYAKDWREKQQAEELARYEKALKVQASDYTGPQVFFNDRYYETVEDAIDSADEAPGYVWAAKDIGLPKANIDSIIENVLDGAWEDADENDLNGVDALQKAVDAFNEANSGVAVFMVDYTRAIVIGDAK